MTSDHASVTPEQLRRRNLELEAALEEARHARVMAEMAEERAREREGRLQDIVELATDGFWEFDEEFCFRYDSGPMSGLDVFSVFGSVLLYIISIGSFFALRKKEPNLNRPFKAPAGILLATICTAVLLFCLYSLIVYNIPALKWVALIYVLAIVYYFIWGRKNIRPYKEEFGTLDELS